MSIVAKPKTFSSGTTAASADVNSNFDAIFNNVNGNLDDTNIAASGITTYGKVNASAINSLGSLNAGAGVIPSANIPTMNYVANDGTVNPTNLLSNGDFESWSAGASAAPDGWTFSAAGGSGTAARGATAKLGTYSLSGAAGTNGWVYYQDIQATKGIEYWKGRTVTFGAWVKSNGSTVVLRITKTAVDPSSAYIAQVSAPVDNNWNWVSVSAVIPSDATTIRLGFWNFTGTTFIDGAMLVEGESAFAFSPKPMVEGFGTAVTKTDGTIYQAGTDGTIEIYLQSISNAKYASFLLDSVTPPVVSAASAFVWDISMRMDYNLSIQVRKGQYYKLNSTGGSAVIRYVFTPIGA